MKLQIGDVLINAAGNTILVVDIDKSGLVKGIFSNETKVNQIGYDRYIIDSLTCGRWRHFPVVK